MNPAKRDCNAWILCRSTRFLGKFYYFNPATGEAVWNLSDMDQRRMISRPSFSQPEKWPSYPEPDSPPEDTANPWVYQPDFHSFNQPVFGQPVFPKYPTNMGSYSPNMPTWGMPQQMYMRPSVMNMPSYEPMPQMWPNVGHYKQYPQDNFMFSNNPYVQKVPYNQPMGRQVFPPRQKQMSISMFPQMSLNKELPKKRTGSSDIIKEPLLKKLRSQPDLQNENLYRAKDNIFGTHSNESSSVETNQNLKNVEQKVCNCMLAKKRSISTPFSRSLGTLVAEQANPFGKQERLFKPSALTRAKSIENLTELPQSEELSSNFSLNDSFIFPLKQQHQLGSRSYENLAETTFSTKKKSDNSIMTQTEPDNENSQTENSKIDLNNIDLRYVLLARRQNSVVKESKDVQTNDNKVSSYKIRTSYTEGDKLRESANKKRVTFNLGVEDSIMADDQDQDIVNDAELESYQEETDQSDVRSFLVADVDALLSGFETIEEFVKTDAKWTLLIPESTRRDIECLCGGLGGGARSRVIAARHITRILADKPPHIEVHAASPSSEETGDPYIDCCMQKYYDGFNVLLVTNNENLYRKAEALEIDCYTVKELKTFLGTLDREVTFDVKKTENIVPQTTKNPVNATRKQQSDNTKQFFLKNAQQKDLNGNQKENLFKTTQDSFLDHNFDLIEETNRLKRDIEKLSFHEKTSAAKEREKEVAIFKNGDDAKFASHTATEHAANKKMQNINVYNVDGFLKCYSVNTKDMEERIIVKMDEYVCMFTQIMEAVLLDVLKDAHQESKEDPSRHPLISVLLNLKTMISDYRTAVLLIDKLVSALDCAFLYQQKRLVLKLNPHEFVKMFGCGCLLIRVLKDILPQDVCLQEGEELLQQLERNIERWGTEPDLPPVTPLTPAQGQPEHRQEFVKDPSEVLRYLSNHYPVWKCCPTQDNGDKKITEVYNNVDNNGGGFEDNKVSNTNVLRTCGRNIGSLILDPKKTLTLTSNKEKAENNARNNNGVDYEPERKETKQVDKPKLMKKLVLESTNMPPKFKEIDVDKRAVDNKNLLQLLQNMVECNVPPKPLTKFYNLKSIIVQNEEFKDKDKCPSKTAVIDDDVKKNDGTKHDVPNKNIVVQKIYDSKMRFQIDSTTKTIDENINNNDANLTKNNKINGESKIKKPDYDPTDLDMLDYSDIEASVIENNGDSSSDSSSNKLHIVESENCNDNDVTTTQRDLSPNDDIGNRNIDKNNEDIVNNNGNVDNNNGNFNNNNGNVDNNNGNIDNYNGNIDNDVDMNADENDDSGIASEQAYSLVQVVLAKLCKTFKVIKDFIEVSIAELRSELDVERKELVFEKAEKTRSVVINMINNLSCIVSREACGRAGRTALLCRGAPSADRRVHNYRRVISKCLKQARILHASLIMLQRISHDQYHWDDLSVVSNTYSNIFE